MASPHQRSHVNVRTETSEQKKTLVQPKSIVEVAKPITKMHTKKEVPTIYTEVSPHEIENETSKMFDELAGLGLPNSSRISHLNEISHVDRPSISPHSSLMHTLLYVSKTIPQP